MTITTLKQHTSNNDPHATLIYRYPSEDFVANIYRVGNGKYLATLPGLRGIVELFDTLDAARDAQSIMIEAAQ